MWISDHGSVHAREAAVRAKSGSQGAHGKHGPDSAMIQLTATPTGKVNEVDIKYPLGAKPLVDRAYDDAHSAPSAPPTSPPVLFLRRPEYRLLSEFVVAVFPAFLVFRSAFITPKCESDFARLVSSVHLEPRCVNSTLCS
jgi:hypothetical protein